jgi:hypothetical protein
VRAALPPAVADKVRLLERAAHELSDIPEGSCDVAVFNSVVQYFPSAAYLQEVLLRVTHKLGVGGAVFVGDVRDHSLSRAFHTEAALRSAEADTPVSTLQAQVAQRITDEEELLLDPSFFLQLPTVLPRVRGVRVLRKRGRARHEMNRYRYDVVLHLDRPLAAAPTIEIAASGVPLTELLRRIDGTSGPLVLTDVADGRVAAAVHCAGQADLTAGAARVLLDSAAGAAPQVSAGDLGVDPEELAAALERRGWHVELRAARSRVPGRIDVVLFREGGPPAWPPVPAADAAPAANDPLTRKKARALLPALRAWLRELLPEYMIPASFTLLPTLPLTPNGKVDRRALPAPDQTPDAPPVAYAPPRTPLEQKLAQAWAEVLGREKVGIQDDFFAIGGHSLAATQLVLRLREILGVQLPLPAVFESPTVAAMAARLGDPR